ncbi:hypothetical protein ACHAWF_013213 [Thalassiosira exigua]
MSLSLVFTLSNNYAGQWWAHLALASIIKYENSWLSMGDALFHTSILSAMDAASGTTMATLELGTISVKMSIT